MGRESRRRATLSNDIAETYGSGADKGLLIESGWKSLVAAAYQDTDPELLAHMRDTFFCGARFTLTALVTLMEPGREVTEKDLLRLKLLNTELAGFLDAYELRYGLAKSGKPEAS